ncbi:hypothetical protein CQA66_06310 [Helicobacter aurati]|uniref:Uncharacterized protein n=1 Tax=Helicobacter aurati TaxID=137778 RepID=A0A3D8J202_9HELI|nr:nickel-binding protein Mua [Helicobacter aurati]RDU71569.1 hypothetical protein CQA66_06310 [Helicobacter aurati]
MKEDEREVLAHIIQNIDEQEIFLEFVAKAEAIKESWQIVKIFENKKKEFAERLREYNLLIKDKEKQLKILTAEITDANNLLKDAHKELDEVQSRLDYVRTNAKIVTKTNQQLTFQCQEEEDVENILDFDGIIGDFQPVTAVSVHVKNGATAMARAAQIIYDSTLYVAYQKASNRLLQLKEYVTKLELTNKKLAVELRDLFEEDSFKEMLNSYEQMLPHAKYDENRELENTISFNPIPKKSHTNLQQDSIQYSFLGDSPTSFPYDSAVRQSNNQFNAQHQQQDYALSDSTFKTKNLHLDSLDFNRKAQKKEQTVEQIFSKLNEILTEDGMSIQKQEAIKEALRNVK